MSGQISDSDFIQIQRLWRSVLIQAYKDLCHPQKLCRDNAKWWFNTPDSGLDAICAVIGTDIKKARARATYISRHRNDQRLRRALFRNQEDDS